MAPKDSSKDKCFLQREPRVLGEQQGPVTETGQLVHVTVLYQSRSVTVAFKTLKWTSVSHPYGPELDSLGLLGYGHHTGDPGSSAFRLR